MIESLSTSLLATKLTAPRLRREFVVRPHLIDRLETSRSYPLTLVSAPAGFGKTTLLAEWAAQSRDPLAWLALDAGDNEPARFWSYLITALNAAQPGSGLAAAQLLQEVQPPAVEPVLVTLINALASSTTDVGLVLDDYQVITRPEIHAGIAFLLDHAPANLHLIVATRVDPLLPLARFRAHGSVLELRAADLRFSTAETGEFLRTALPLGLSAEQIASLQVRTEGWIAGLQLAALALAGQGAEHIPDFIEASAGSNRYVIDYLVEEVLEGLDPEVQDFLCQTSVLDRLSPALCAAVTGRSDSGEMLARLEHTNLFLDRLDAAANWYRYHSLFADVLRKLLYQRTPELAPELHRRAAVWYGGQHLLRDAIGHALAVPDYELAARLIDEAGVPPHSAGEAPVGLESPAALPPDLLHSRPFTEALGLAAERRWLRVLGEEAAAPATVPPRLPAGSAAPRATGDTAALTLRAAALVEPLSRRELEVLRLLADGLANRDIADRLIVSIGTVKSHIHSIYGKLGARDRGEAISQAHELNLV